MCGIAGYVGTRKLDSERIESCLASLRSRGPDHAGHFHVEDAPGRHVHLLVTRLRIIDLEERANQPFRAGGLTLVFNGELYNYIELRRELEREGETFSTASDTEVLLRVLARRGADGLDACEGMWAFALHDPATGAVTLSRDRFGEKPLYLHRADDGVYFGSEPKAIFTLLGRTLDIDLDHVRRFLVNGYRALYKEERTFFRGLDEVGRATVVELARDGEERRRPYWQPAVEAEDEMGYDEAVAGVRERLVRSVELRLRADVPLAFCMSGGVDSNALIAIAKRVCGYDVHGFTVENDDWRYDERDQVQAAVADLRIRHTRSPVESDRFLERLRDLVRYHDAPVATITYYAHSRLMALVAGHGYRVAVSGTGADELFTGYYDHHLAYLAEVRGEPALHAAAVRAWENEILPHVRNPFLTDPDLFVDDSAFRGHIFLGVETFVSYLTNGFREEFSERRYSSSLLRNRMLNELFHEVVPVILHEDDLNAMRYSIENRSPYLDRALFDFAYRIPSRHLVREGRAKAVLRDAVRGIAADRIVDEPRKVGFNAPVFAFLDRDDPDVRADLLADSPIYEHVRRERIAELLNRPELLNSESKFLFSFVSSKIFLEELSAA